MARYIDADELIEMCERMKQDPWNQGTAPHSWADAYDDFESDILRQPTSNVVPKSEVERWRRNLEAVLEERAETRAEVAREIFEEIEYNFEDLRKVEYANAPLQIVFNLLDYLKKKYTEEE